MCLLLLAAPFFTRNCFYSIPGSTALMTSMLKLVLCQWTSVVPVYIDNFWWYLVISRGQISIGPVLVKIFSFFAFLDFKCILAHSNCNLNFCRMTEADLSNWLDETSYFCPSFPVIYFVISQCSKLTCFVVFRVSKQGFAEYKSGKCEFKKIKVEGFTASLCQLDRKNIFSLEKSWL